MEFSWYGEVPRRYCDPIEVLETADIGGVAPALRRLDDALAAGYSVAGYIAYEAGFAFNDPSLAAPGDEPLLALGIFEGPSAIADVPGGGTLGPLVAGIDRERYASDLAAIARALHAGDVYQINYTVPFAFATDGDPAALAAALRAGAEVPYAAFVRHRGRALVSLSPELFFAIDGDRVRTKPMKGTSLPDAPATLATPKNRAEHVMIVDLLRNDLHRICDEVAVTELFAIEAYPTFATMTSTIEGTLARERGLADVFAALFPCGSITGAPKRSAMAHIAALESARRSVAMGTLGYCDAPRRGVWNVAIRTAIVDTQTGTGELRIGGGIVADSHGAAEWAEILVKRRAFDAIARPCGLIETMRARADGTIARLDAHLARLERSAFALGIPCDAPHARGRVLAFAASCAPRTDDLLLRLELDREGALRLAQRPLQPMPDEPRACLTTARVRSSDPTVRHKTTERAVYDAASAFAGAAGSFEGLLLNERGTLADGARTTIFLAEDDGMLATPPLEDGALAGVLRAELLANGRAYERTIRPAELAERPAFLGNSARGLLAVRVDVDTAAAW